MGGIMRKVTFGCACSLDNFIAREDGSFDWILHDDEANKLMSEYWPKIDTMIVGRKTHDIAVGMRSSSKKKSSKNPYGNLKTYVFSRSVEPGERDGVTFVSGDPGKFVGKLKRQQGKEICIMSGGDLGTSLINAGVVDEIGLNIQPVLLGSGVPLFHRMKKQIDLELIESRSLNNGCVYIIYRVKN
jgi:dihydrofolate reductase